MRFAPWTWDDKLYMGMLRLPEDLPNTTSRLFYRTSPPACRAISSENYTLLSGLILNNTHEKPQAATYSIYLLLDCKRVPARHPHLHSHSQALLFTPDTLPPQPTIPHLSQNHTYTPPSHHQPCPPRKILHPPLLPTQPTPPTPTPP